MSLVTPHGGRLVDRIVPDTEAEALRARARELYDWLENGAHLYLCGDAGRLAPAVDAALVEAVALAQGAGPERAAAYVRALVENKRYQKDVY